MFNVSPHPYRQPTPLLVGVDGSPSGLVALGWAVREAARRGGRLTACYVTPWVWPWDRLAGAEDPSERSDKELVREVLSAATRAAARTEPAVTVDEEILDGGAAAALVRRSVDVALMVVGRRTGTGVGLLIGSTAAELAAHACCSVAVVPDTVRRVAGNDTGVLLGVDESAGCEAAIAWAFDHAERTGRPITAVHAVDWLAHGPHRRGSLRALEAEIGNQRELLDDLLTAWSGKHPDVTVRGHVATGHAATVIRDAGWGADVVVLGARGSGGFTGLPLGSVADALIRYGDRPVVIAR